MWGDVELEAQQTAHEEREQGEGDVDDEAGRKLPDMLADGLANRRWKGIAAVHTGS
jgi:hypothetical protein